MQQTVLLNKKGLTLVEVLIALAITLVLFLALMQTALLSIEMNIKNLIRDEAVKIASERMSEARNEDFDTLDDDDTPIVGDCPDSFPANGVLIERNIRNITAFDFCTNRDVTTLANGDKQVNIRVDWKWKGEDYTHSISTILREE